MGCRSGTGTRAKAVFRNPVNTLDDRIATHARRAWLAAQTHEHALVDMILISTVKYERGFAGTPTAGLGICQRSHTAMPDRDHVKLCANCNKRPRAGRLPWCRPCLDHRSRRAHDQRRAIGKAYRRAMRDYARPPERGTP